MLQPNGLVEKANLAARKLWPLLLETETCMLWQLDPEKADQSRKFLDSLHGKSATESRLTLTAAGKNTANFVWQQLSREEDQLLLQASELQPYYLKLPEAAVLPPAILQAVLNALPHQMIAVLDAQMRYLSFSEAYKQEFMRTFATHIAVGDSLMATMEHLPDEQQKALLIWEQVLKGESFCTTQTFGHSSLTPTTYRIKFIPLKDATGNFLGALYQVRNLSEEQLQAGQLQNSEKRFRMLAEHTPDIVLRFGLDMQVLYANAATREETGFSPAELVGKSLFELPFIHKLPESYILKVKQSFDTGLEHDLISTHEQNQVLKNFFTRFIPEKNAEGDIVSVIAVSRNISDLQEAKQELLIARDFVFMADIIPQLLWITEPNGNVSFFNQRWFEYTGLDKKDSLFWGWQKVIHPEDLQETLLVWEQCLQSAETYQVEYRLRRHDGSYRWFIGRGMPMKDAKGNVLKWYGFCADIQEERQNRSELAQRAQELQMLNQMIPQIVWSARANGMADFFNQRWYQYTGLSYESSHKLGWTSVLHPEDLERTLEAWKNSYQNGETYQIECRFRKYDGHYRWFIARATPQKDSGGQIIKWFGTCTDIHDQKQQSEAFAQKNYELQQINAYLAQFVHTAAHDLRSPVANMKLLYDMLMREENPEKKQKLLDTFKPLLNRLDNTIIGLVEIVQMQEGHRTLRVQKVDLFQVLQEVKEELSDQLQEANALLEEDIRPGKPLYYLKAYLLSMLRNLLSNAIKYRQPDQSLKVKITAAWKDKYYWINIEDNGMGMDLQRNEKNLFRPFKRLTHKGEGLGIGLHMVQNMVQKNGGEITVSSEPGKGASFSLFLCPYQHD